jgi:hypothetical protein
VTDSKYTSRATEGLHKLAQHSYKSMCMLHAPAYRAMYSGGAGIAYTFWKAACFFDDPEWLHQARFWIDHVIAAPEDEPIMRIPEKPGEFVEIDPRDSFLFGNRGIWFVRALIAHAEDNNPGLEKSLKYYTERENQKPRVQEYLQGIAGRLVGCALLYRQTGAQILKAYGDGLAGELIGSAHASNADVPWCDNRRLGFAHGRAGNYYGLLLWNRQTDYPLPEWLYSGLRQLASLGRKHEHGLAWPVEEDNEHEYMDSWCNGAPGLIHLWCRAYDCYGDAFFLDTARAAGEYCAHLQDSRFGHICCGTAGVAYALLSLNGIDPGKSWLHHAARYAGLADKGMPMKPWRLSLYGGLAGTVCLMLDMSHPEQAEQPAVQG